MRTNRCREIFLDLDRHLPSQRSLLDELRRMETRLLVAIMAGAMGWTAFFVVVFMRAQ